MKTSVIMPSTGRPKQLVECLNQICKVSPSVEIVCVIDHDPDSVKAVNNCGLDVVVVEHTEYMSAIYGWNKGASVASGDAFVFASDDCWFRERWLEEATKALRFGSVVGFNNSYTPPKHFTDQYLVTREYAKNAWGGVLCCPHYKHMCADIEACVHADMDDEYVYAENAIIEHRHYNYDDDIVMDDGYERVASYRKRDSRIYHDRKRRRFPTDYEGVF